MTVTLSNGALEAFEELLTISMDARDFVDDGTDAAVELRTPLLAELTKSGWITIEGGEVRIAPSAVTQMLDALTQK